MGMGPWSGDTPLALGRDLVLLNSTFVDPRGPYRWASGEGRDEILNGEFCSLLVTALLRSSRGSFQNCVWTMTQLLTVTHGGHPLVSPAGPEGGSNVPWPGRGLR